MNISSYCPVFSIYHRTDLNSLSICVLHSPVVTSVIVMTSHYSDNDAVS